MVRMSVPGYYRLARSENLIRPLGSYIITQMDILYTFIEEYCKDNNIDPSHDVTHSKDCVNFLRRIMNPFFTEEEVKMGIYAAALHDCVDRKYVDEVIASLTIRQFLDSIGWDEGHIDSLLNMITTMSYSKLKAQKIGTTCVYPEHGRWQRVYHTVRQADLLCSFRVHRCYQYQLRIHPDWTEEQHWKRVREMFNERIFRYVEDGWFESRNALSLIPELTEQAKKDLEVCNAEAPPGYGC